MEKRRDQQTEFKAKLIEQINLSLRSGNYSQALDLLRGTTAEFPNDAELSALEKLAQDGVKRKAEADRLITESQELFSQQKSAEALQLLREAYALDKNNSLARSILANALVEHAHSLVETNWLEAEKVTKQALDLNPSHPTAKSIYGLIVEQKKNSSVEDWVIQAQKLQSSGDLFAALAWVAEGLAVHPDEPKLLQIQNAIQRDQGARRRQARRGDLENLRRMELEISGATDIAAKQALAERIQTVAAKHWTDGEILSIANALLLRLGLVPQKGSAASPQSKSGTVIFHVPRPSAPKAADADSSPAPVVAGPVSPTPVAPKETLPGPISAENIRAVITPPTDVSPTPEVPRKILASSKPAQIPPPPPVAIAVAAPSASADKVTSRPSQPKKTARSLSTTLIVCSATVLILVAAIFLTRKHPVPEAAKNPTGTSASTAPAVSAPAVTSSTEPASPVSTPVEVTAQPSQPEPRPSSDAAEEKVRTDNRPSADSSPNVGTLLVVVGQDDAKVILNGRVQRPVTRSGQLRLPGLEAKDYVVQVSKNGFQDPPQQRIRIRKGEEATLTFNLQPQPRLGSLSILGGAPGTAVFVDQTPVGTIQSDGSLSVATISPGDHIVELRKERFKSRQFTKHFVAGGTVSLAAADAVLEAMPGGLKITFAPPDTKVALVKGDHLAIVSSGVPLNLAPGTYTLTARTADGFTSSSTIEVVAGQSRTLNLSLAPHGMTNFDDPGAWKREGDSFVRKGGDFVLYRDVPTSGTFVFSAIAAKGHLLQWVLNYADPKNYLLFQMDDNNFYRSVIRNGQKSDEIIVPHKGDKRSFRTLHIRVSSTEIIHQIRRGDSWTVLDRWTQPGTNLGQGKFGFYIPGSDQVQISTFSHYADLSIR